MSLLMRSIAEQTGGNLYTEDAVKLKEVIDKALVYRPAPANARTLQPVWFWLVMLAGIVFCLMSQSAASRSNRSPSLRASETNLGARSRPGRRRTEIAPIFAAAEESQSRSRREFGVPTAPRADSTATAKPRRSGGADDAAPARTPTVRPKSSEPPPTGPTDTTPA